MPITWSIDSEGRYAVLSVADPYTMDEWREAMTAILQAPIQRSHIAMMVDRRDAKPLTSEAVQEMTRFFAEHQAVLAGGRAAIVVNDEANYGMGRMTQLRSRRDIPNTTIRIFRSYDEAFAWLTGPPGQDRAGE